LNTETIVQTGQPGLAVNLNRVRLVNGIKTGSDASKTIQLAAAVDEILRVGTQAVVKTTTVEGTTFDYWFSAPMYATTYAPTEGGGPTTYSGQPVTHGVAAVIRAWYPAMAGQPIYVTGYGYATIEDIGGGIPGKPWIDLAYDDATYQAWSGWVTVYFLPPVAPAIIEILN
jgi:3D (Asp-Asp-Asp) domain-containing protein